MKLAKWTIAALVILAAYLPGCSHLVVRPGGFIDGQDRAMTIVWNEVYGRTDQPPAIRWITEFDCDDPISGKPGFPVFLVTGWTCREGYTVVPWQCEVSLHTDDHFSDTAMAHEMAHSMQMRMGVIDTQHKTNEVWGAGGLVEKANENLVKEGL